MILVIGGAFQGKRNICCQLLDLEEAAFLCGLADGRADDPEQALRRPYLAAYQEFVRQVLDQGMDPEEYTRMVLKAQPEIISMDEVGCGIVPIDRSDRDYREAAGRCGQLLAAEAEEVYRVVCGIPARIK